MLVMVELRILYPKVNKLNISEMILLTYLALESHMAIYIWAQLGSITITTPGAIKLSKRHQDDVGRYMMMT